MFLCVRVRRLFFIERPAALPPHRRRRLARRRLAPSNPPSPHDRLPLNPQHHNNSRTPATQLHHTSARRAPFSSSWGHPPVALLLSFRRRSCRQGKKKERQPSPPKSSSQKRRRPHGWRSRRARAPWQALRQHRPHVSRWFSRPAASCARVLRPLKTLRSLSLLLKPRLFLPLLPRLRLRIAPCRRRSSSKPAWPRPAGPGANPLASMGFPRWAGAGGFSWWRSRE